MNLESNNDIQIEPGKRKMPSLPNNYSNPPTRVMDPFFRQPDVRLLDLEYQNQILLNKLDKYHRAMSKGIDFVYKDNLINTEEIPLNYNNKANYVNALQDKIVEITKSAEKSGKVELLERNRLLEIKMADQKDTLSLVSTKYIKLKQKYLNTSRNKKEVGSLLETAKNMRDILGEFEMHRTMNVKRINLIDFPTFDVLVKQFEDEREREKKVEKGTSKVSKKEKVDAQTEYETKKREKVLNSLQEHIESLKEQLNTAQTDFSKREAGLSVDLRVKLEEEKKRTQRVIDENNYKFTQRSQKIEEELVNLRQNNKLQVEDLQIKLALELEEKEGFRTALGLRDFEFDTVSRKYNELKIKMIKNEEKFKKLAADQKLSISNLMNSALIKVSEVSKSALQEVHQLKPKTNEEGTQVIEFELEMAGQNKQDLVELQEIEAEIDQLEESKKVIEVEEVDQNKENAQLEEEAVHIDQLEESKKVIEVEMVGQNKEDLVQLQEEAVQIDQLEESKKIIEMERKTVDQTEEQAPLHEALTRINDLEESKKVKELEIKRLENELINYTKQDLARSQEALTKIDQLEKSKKVLEFEKKELENEMAKKTKQDLARLQKAIKQIDQLEKSKKVTELEKKELENEMVNKTKQDLARLQETVAQKDQLEEFKKVLELEIKGLEKEMVDIQMKLDDVSRENEVMNGQIVKLTMEFANLTLKYQKLSLENSDLKAKNELMEESIIQKDKIIKENNSLIIDLEEKVVKLTEDLKLKTEELMIEQIKNSGLTVQLEDAEKANKVALVEIADQSKIIEDQNDKLRMYGKMVDEFTVLKNEHKEICQELFQTKQELEKTVLEIRENEQNYNNLIQEIFVIKKENTEFDEKMRDIKLKHRLKLKELQKEPELKKDDTEYFQKRLDDKDKRIQLITSASNLQTEEMRILKDRIENLNVKLDEKNDDQIQAMAELTELSKYKLIFDEIKNGVSDYMTIKNENFTLAKTNKGLRDEIIRLNDFIEQIKIESEKLKMEIARNDQNFEIAALKKKLTQMEKVCFEIKNQIKVLEGENWDLKIINESMGKDLLGKIKEHERFEGRIKEVEEMIFGTKAKKPIQSYELQVAQQEILKANNEKNDVLFKLSTVELLNLEKTAQVGILENEIQDLRNRYALTVNLASLVESKDQQIFEMILNTNRKQKESEELKEEVGLLKIRLEILTNETRMRLLDKKEEEEISSGQKSSLEIYRIKYRIGEDLFGKKEELVKVYRLLEKSEELFENKGTVSNKTLKESSDGFGGEQTEILNHLKLKLEKYETLIALSEKKEEEFLEKEEKLEKERKIGQTKMEKQDSKIQQNVVLIEELKCAFEDHEKTIKTQKTELAKVSLEILEKEKQNLHVLGAMNHQSLEMNSKNTQLRINESKLSALKHENEMLVEQTVKLAHEIITLNEAAFLGAHNLLFELNDEKDKSRLKDQLLVPIQQENADLRKKERDSREVIEVKVDEMRKLRVLLNSQSDKIDLLMRVNKMPSETLKELREANAHAAEKDIIVNRVSDLTAENQSLLGRLVLLDDDLGELRKEEIARKEELIFLRKIQVENGLELNQLREKLIDKNNFLSKLQGENLRLTGESESANETTVLIKLVNADLVDQIFYLTKQVDQVFERLKVPASYSHKSTETEELSSQLAIEEQQEKKNANNEKIIREYRRKIKVKDDRIRNLSENLELMNSNALEPKIYLAVKPVALGSVRDVSSNKELEELKNKLVEIEAKLDAKEIYEYELVDILYEKRTAEMLRKQVLNESQREVENYKDKVDTLSKEVYHGQEIIAKYALSVHQMKQEQKESKIKVEGLNEQLKQQRQTIETIESEINELKIELNETKILKNQIEKNAKNETEKFRSEFKELESKKQDLDKLVQANLAPNEVFSQEIAFKEKEIFQLSTKIAEISLKVNSFMKLENEMEILNNKIENLKNKTNEGTLQITALKREVEKGSQVISNQQETISEQELTIGSLSFEIAETHEINKRGIKNMKTEQEMKLVSFNKVIENQRNIIGKNYKAYINRLNNCNKEIKLLRKKIGGELEGDWENELKSSLIYEELFEKEQYQDTLTGSSRSINLLTVENSGEEKNVLVQLKLLANIKELVAKNSILNDRDRLLLEESIGKLEEWWNEGLLVKTQVNVMPGAANFKKKSISEELVEGEQESGKAKADLKEIIEEQSGEIERLKSEHQQNLNKLVENVKSLEEKNEKLQEKLFTVKEEKDEEEDIG